TLVVSDTALILAAVVATGYMRLGVHAWPIVVADMLPKAVLITLVSQLCLYYSDLYDDPHVGGSRAELLIRILQALGITLLILAGVSSRLPARTVRRVVRAWAAPLAAAVVIAWLLAFGVAARQV